MKTEQLQQVFEANAKRFYELIKPDKDVSPEQDARDFTVFRTGYMAGMADIPRILGVETVQQAVAMLSKKVKSQMVIQGGKDAS